jgi:alpha-glucosidase
LFTAQALIGDSRFHYPSDAATHAIQSQFFYGPSLLISPVTDEDSTSVTFYLPNDVYYDLFTLKRVANTGASGTYSDVAFTDIPVFIKGGSIIPARVSSANTTTALRNENFELIIAPGADGMASGRLYLDDGESVEQQGTSDITFMYDGGTVKMHGVCAYATNVSVVSVTVLGEGNATKFQISEDLNGPWSHDLRTMRGAGL